MTIHFIVHDCFLQIGHTRAMIEVLRETPLAPGDRIRIICFTSEKKEILFPHKHEQVDIVTIPFKGLKPFLLKSVFFQLYTSLFKKRLIEDQGPIITMGVCSLIGTIVNVQFYHHDWEALYFKYNKGNLFKNIYKKILLRYLSLCENLYFKKQGLKFVFLSQFIADRVSKRFELSPENYQIAYSSVNFEHFMPKEELKPSELTQSYPVLQNLDPLKPTLLFVGAFERKGLPFLTENLPDNVNLIVIGQGEAQSAYKLPDAPHIFWIKHTKEIEKFYHLADAFIFPTFYEPFGLVVLEAAASGCEVYVSRDQVGASEIIEGLPGVHFIDSHNFKTQLQNISKVSRETKVENARKRKEAFAGLTWKDCAKKWQQIL